MRLHFCKGITANFWKLKNKTQVKNEVLDFKKDIHNYELLTLVVWMSYWKVNLVGFIGNTFKILKESHP
jgi:hypothetical protein